MSNNDSIRQDEPLSTQDGAMKTVRSVLIFVLGLAAFFSLGFFVIGPRMQRGSAPAPTTQTAASDKDTWGQAPPPPKPAPKPTGSVAEVEVNEISPRSDSSTNANSGAREADTLEQLSHSDETPAPSTPEAAETEASSRSPRHFYVQVGVYEDKGNARILASRLADEGYGTSIRQINRNGTAAYQVVIGAAREKADAQKLVDELKTAGKDVMIAPAD
ncbi:MAG: SPOR domain-containing protein [Armatimonadota bacterium]|nr:SPOR domain-containing protein [Armatimonadota bacterium]